MTHVHSGVGVGTRDTPGKPCGPLSPLGPGKGVTSAATVATNESMSSVGNIKTWGVGVGWGVLVGCGVAEGTDVGRVIGVGVANLNAKTVAMTFCVGGSNCGVEVGCGVTVAKTIGVGHVGVSGATGTAQLIVITSNINTPLTVFTLKYPKDSLRLCTNLISLQL